MSSKESATFSVRVPRATYRLQFHAGFTLRDATQIVPYLARLGVSDLYASPLSRARAGSAHGYDVCDPNALNPELGSEADWERFGAVLREHGLGLVLDIVPNHMGVGDPANRWWWDVLEQGQTSAYARFFDIDWDPPRRGLSGKVLVPLLGDPWGEVLERGELRLVEEGGRLCVAYYDHRLPVNLSGWAGVLAEFATAVEADVDLSALVVRLQDSMPEREAKPWSETGWDDAWTAWKRSFAEALEKEAGLRELFHRVLADINGQPGDPGSFVRLGALLADQHYQLAWWRMGTAHLNYRRFFDITHLAGLRVELPEVLLRSHELVARWWHEGVLTGLRIDHPDGLWNPAEYLRRLQRLASEASAELADAGQVDERGRAAYVVVEKILSPGEVLPRDWPVHGTTGYDFLNVLNALFVSTEQAENLTRIYNTFTDRSPVFADEVRRNKLKVLEQSLLAELEALTDRWEALMAGTREAGDYPRMVARQALAEMIAAFPVYRTYAEAASETLGAFDEGCIASAVRGVGQANPSVPKRLIGLIGEVLCLRWPGGDSLLREQAKKWVMRFQQLTGPAMAKGLEDTTFYTFNRLISLNEVGGHPSHFGVSLEEFHRVNHERCEQWPGSMLATATHDTKRGEDVRARINVLAELPEVWERTLAKAQAFNGVHQLRVKGEPAPSANDAYLLYQTLIGLGLPSDAVLSEGDTVERITAFWLKAAREAKTKTAWVDGDAEYERALVHFVGRILDPQRSEPFLALMRRVGEQVSWFGRFNSWGQTLVKLTAPGVPDLYQGTEFWDLSLVDPDNRRPVDYATRGAWLEELETWLDWEPARHELEAARLVQDRENGERAKLWLIWRTLMARRRHPELWEQGDYVPLPAVGHLSNHVVAYARLMGSQGFLVVVPRLVVGLTGGAEHVPIGDGVWSDTELTLPEGWSGAVLENWLTGGQVRWEGRCRLSELFGVLPFALLGKRH